MVDRHVVKMITETNQLLCSTLIINNAAAPYKLTHKNHPCRKWIDESSENFDWLVNHLEALCYEFSYRYDKIHKGESLVDFHKNNKHKIKFIDQSFTSPPLAMKEEFKISKDAVKSYRHYYKYGKSHLHSWKKRSVPEWINRG